jgi:hypothetical protein
MATSFAASARGSFWHQAEMGTAVIDFRFRGSTPQRSTSKRDIVPSVA